MFVVPTILWRSLFMENPIRHWWFIYLCMVEVEFFFIILYILGMCIIIIKISVSGIIDFFILIFFVSFFLLFFAIAPIVHSKCEFFQFFLSIKLNVLIVTFACTVCWYFWYCYLDRLSIWLCCWCNVRTERNKIHTYLLTLVLSS